MPKPFPKEFRQDVVVVARKGEASISQIAKDFGISESCLRYTYGDRPNYTVYRVLLLRMVGYPDDFDFED